jgi:transcriptional regulator with XRE-family HTH domain
MPNTKTNTQALLQRLLKTSSISRFFQRYDEDISHFPSFGEYISDLCTEKGVTAESVIKKTAIERTYGHQLFNGTRTPSRDKVLQLAFGFEMDYAQAQKLLAVSRKSPLHPKIKRDAAVIFALKNGLDMDAVQATLHELGLPVLGEGGKL